MSNRKVIASDTTLRDGHQQPGLAFTLAERIYIAHSLRDIGVDVIEAGFPANSCDAEPVYKIAQQIRRGPKISALARVVKSDIDAAYRALQPAIDRGEAMVHTFIGTSDMLLENSVRKSAEEVAEMVGNMVRYAVGLFGDVQFSPEDATRTPLDYLDTIIATAIQAGATRVNIPDTVGYYLSSDIPAAVSFPKIVRHVISAHPAIRSGKVILSVHCHNDFDGAVQSTLAGIASGAAQFEGTINGIGERAGNTDLFTVIEALRTYEALYRKIARAPSGTGHINTALFHKVSREMDMIAGMATYDNRPVTGTNAFRDSSGIHAAAVQRNPGTYHIMSPEDVGGRLEIVIGPTSGTNIVRRIVDKFGYEASDSALQELTEGLKREAIRRKDGLTEPEAHVYIRRALGLSPPEDPIRMGEWNVVTGSTIPTATVNLYVNGEHRYACHEGVGAIDAAAKAILTALNGTLIDEVKLSKFEEQPVSSGTEAVARARVALQYKGEIYWGRSLAPDIVVAGVSALLNALNSIYVLNQK
ncbi:hypothetical protein HYU15_04415 [Candidatus Woesearchaeota archaeon]|nr:hypothetical protein [Candidatus Woesearchaeota archaeon]